MSIEQQLGQRFASVVLGKLSAGQALEQSARAATDFLGWGDDPFHQNSQNQQSTQQLDGCALNAK